MLLYSTAAILGSYSDPGIQIITNEPDIRVLLNLGLAHALGIRCELAGCVKLDI
jgi:hypothetical protein